MDDGSNQFRVYEDFQPSTDLYEVEQTYVLLLNLPGFKKEHMRVKLNSLGTLTIGGERPLPNNKWSRFSKEFPTPPDCDITQIRAKLENGILKVIMPKTETTNQTAPKPPQAAPSPPPPTTEPSRTSRPSSLVPPPPNQKPATEWKSPQPTTPLPPPLPQATSVPKPSQKPAKEPILPTPKTPTQPQPGKSSHQLEAKTDEGRHEDDESTTSTDDDYTTTSSDDDKDEKKLVGDAEKQMKKDNDAEKSTKSKSSPPPLPQQKPTSVPERSRKTATGQILSPRKTPSQPTQPSHHLKARTDEGRREDDEFTTTSSDSDEDEKKPLKGADKLMKKDNGAERSRKTKLVEYKNKIKGFTMELKEQTPLSSNKSQLVVKIVVGGLAMVSLLVYIAWSLKFSQEN